MESLAGSCVVCGYCGSGCRLRMVGDAAGPVGISPILTHPTSEGRLCRRGWTSHQPLRDSGRIRSATIKKAGGKAVSVSWEDAIAHASEMLAGSPAGATAIIASPTSSNESLYLLGKLGRTFLSTQSIDFPGGSSTLAIQRLMARWIESTCGIREVDSADVIIAIGLGDGDACPQIVPAVWRAISRKAAVISVDSWKSDLFSEADIAMTPLPHADAVWIDALGSALSSRYEPRIPAEDAVGLAGIEPGQIERAAELLRGAKRIAVVTMTTSMDRLADRRSIDALGRLLSVLRTTGDWLGILPLFERSNTLGAIDMGIGPDLLPGWRDAGDAEARASLSRAWDLPVCEADGVGIPGILEAGGIRSLLVIGDLPGLGLPGSEELLAGLERIPLRIAVSAFPSAWTDSAHIVIPRPLPGETEGTFTNTEGRVQWSRQCQPPPARQEWEIWAALATALGAPWRYATIHDLRSEIARVVPGYEPLAEASIEGTGEFVRTLWEVGELGRRLPADAPLPGENGDAQSLLLCVEQVYLPYHFDSEILRSPIMRRELAILPNEPHVLIHPADAKEAVLRDQGRGVLRTGHGETSVRIACRSDVPRGRIIVPDIYARLVLGPLLPDGASGKSGLYAAVHVAVAPK